MRERDPEIGLAAAAVGVIALCCGFPVLTSLGAVGIVAGVSLTSWSLVGLGTLVAALAFWRRRHRSRPARSPRATHSSGAHPRRKDC